MVTRDEALEAWPAAYDPVCAGQPGFYTRNEAWWKHMTLRVPDGARRMGTRYFVQYEEDGRVLGYSRYRVRPDGVDGLPDGKLIVEELTAGTDAAYAALWQFIFGVDLVGEITATHRPIDEPLFWMLADPRRMVRRPYDTLWVRIIDVPAALEGRRYGAAGSLVLDVRDEFLPWAGGRFQLEAGLEGALCRPSAAEPHLELSAADLGAIYLGGTKPSDLARSGRVQGDASALRLADAMFSWEKAPWCQEVF
jgi:predicted acetyltransferase